MAATAWLVAMAMLVALHLSGGLAMLTALGLLTAMAATAWLAAMGLLTGLGLADRHGCAASVLGKRLPLICFRNPKAKTETGNRFQNTETETPPKFFYVREMLK